MKTPHIRKSISRSPLQRSFVVIAFTLVCFALPAAPKVFGVTPPPGGGYPNNNTALGGNALFRLTSGFGNTAIGNGALFNNTTGGNNTGTGLEALSHNTTGNYNTATGFAALFNNTTGVDNTANGFGALNFNTTGIENTANGFKSLYNNTTGGDNTANGFGALFSNTIGFYNAANGWEALLSNTTGSDNTAHGYQALYHNTTGISNIALGFDAGFYLTTGSHNIDIGNLGMAGESAHIRIGTVGAQTATFVAGINGVAVTGSAVLVSSSGQLGVAASSKRFKDKIEPMGKASESLLSLRPVSFRYKKNIDPKGVAQFGLVAEEVEKVNPDLVVRDADGKAFTVRYEAVNAMLLNEFLKEHKKVEDLDKDLRATIVQQQKEIAALTTNLQKMSAQLELTKSAPQRVANNQ